ncbi:MAG: hypothetical protein LBT40_01125 [Deltaproteobacteria bacterium]|nr:hypothetical protein [Deltaproteobacteria bacterium]
MTDPLRGCRLASRLPDGPAEVLRKASPDRALAERRLDRVRGQKEAPVVPSGTGGMARTNGNGRSSLACMPGKFAAEG